MAIVPKNTVFIIQKKRISRWRRAPCRRFLEHSRIFYFENAGTPQLWLSSADWMTRNMDKRIELRCPLLNEEHQSVVIQYLLPLLNDNKKARQLP
ncbi:hypothetical protein [Paenibacillus sp. NPDC055715]